MLHKQISMDVLLAQKGIYRFTEADEAEEHVYSYCFTDEMIQKHMIVLLEQHTEHLMDDDEPDEEDAEVEGTEGSDWEDDGVDEADMALMASSDAEYETSIAILYLGDHVTYRFQLYHSCEPVLAPLVVFRVILDAIETIRLSNEKTLIANLASIATGVSTAEELKNKEWRNNSYNLTVDKINTALRLYSEHKSQ